ncbi:MAG TPA: LysR substrate-binding domain-containing protein [Lysobacter sp.]
MEKPLRSLSGLIDFESAARWNSFRLAAVELHKTPAAVSQQVKQLEQSLGFPLFTRHPRHVALTEKGRELASTVAGLLRELHAKVGALQEEDEESVLRIATTHSFAMKWLVPRLHRFTERHPEFDIRVESGDTPIALDGDASDVALRYSPIAGADQANILYREHLVVAYSPELDAVLRERPSPPSLAELLRYPLLCEGTPELWLRLLAANGVARQHYDFSRSYSHAGLLVQAAVAGLGVALVQYSLAYEDIRKNRLVVCPSQSLVPTYCYRLLCSNEKREIAKVRHFAEWIRAEVADMSRTFKDGVSAMPASA